MPLTTLHGYRIPKLNHQLRGEYWPGLTVVARQQHGAVVEVRDAAAVEAALKDCFRYLEQQFMTRIQAEARVSFYATVHRFHESTTALMLSGQVNDDQQVNGEEFAGMRRALKLILEQGCGNDLHLAVNFDREALNNWDEYVDTLDHLVMLGYWASQFAGFISQLQLFPGAVGLRFEEPGGLDVVLYQPFGLVSDYVMRDMHRQAREMVVQDTFEQLKVVLQRELGIDYDHVTEFLGSVPDTLALIKPHELFKLLQQERDYDPQHLASFFAGLTLSRANKLSFGECIIRNQNICRYLYRPILHLHTDGGEYWLVGNQKWLESRFSLSTNAIPFAVCPAEWQAYLPVRRFVSQVNDSHDKVLERPLASILTQQGWPFEANVKAIRGRERSVSLVTKNVGEIDLLFIDHKHQILYVGECKHNRSRFEMAGWRGDYQHFVRDYEPQLRNKVIWVTDNLADVAAHFARATRRSVDLTGYRVEGIFLINAPSIYLYDARYRTFTIAAFRRLVNGRYREHTIRFTPPGRQPEKMLKRPYFQQALAIVAAAVATQEEASNS